MSQHLRSPASADLEAPARDQIRVGRIIFDRIETGSSSKAWRCQDHGIQILERVREPGRFWEYVAARIDSASDQPRYLANRDCIRRFTDPTSAAKAAVREWC
jgi:hypothetical protein